MYFTREKATRYLNDLKKYIYQDRIPIKDFKYFQGDIKGADQIDFNDHEWDDFTVGSFWGGRDVTVWFRNMIEVPAGWKKNKLALNLILGAGQEGGLRGSESLIFINGHPVQGLDRNHSEVYLNPEWFAKGQLKIAIKAFSGLQNELKLFKTAELVEINEETEDFYFRAKTILDSLEIINSESYNFQYLLKILNDAINDIDFRKPGSKIFYESIKRANELLRDRLKENEAEKQNRPVITAVGHSHIDVAWLWQLKHTREKCSRTFSTVNHLMDQYPEYQFLQSSPQLYEFIKEDYPEIFEEIKQRVREGKWEVTGGMWVEADCNLPSGESLIRQFLFGTRFMKKEFGVDCNILWLPDVFGYSWALPQIITKSGLKYFMTTKISWSQYNRPQYDTFNWRGLDGTEVLTHFITTTESETPRFYTYNGILDPTCVVRGWNHYQQKDINDELLFAYGWGDGGGGPTKEMIETGKKMKEISALPKVKFGKAEPFFKRLEEKVKGNSKFPVVDGELYLEYHRGTYTSQAKIKKNNRKSEILYHDLELFNGCASKYIDDYCYPQIEINKGWKTILRNQFHDILPGSSIHEVYVDSEDEFAKVFESGNKLLNDSFEALAENVKFDGEKLLVFNSLSWARDGVVTLPWNEELKNKSFITEDEDVLLSKIVENGDKKEIEIKVPEIPSLGYRTFRVIQKKANLENKKDIELKVSNKVIENRYFRIKLNENGQIISIFDKKVGREILPQGMAANVFQAFEDRPMNFDAWDIDIYYREKEYRVDNLLDLKIEETGPDKAVIRFKWRFLDSEIEQRMVVYADKRRIDFKTDIDWHEHQILLKVAFPVDVRTTKATYEIQFGNVERPTHWNTSWDFAKFETVAQKWADLSERDYGVSLLNDCKYGYDIKDNFMRLTLIKSGIEPDPEADQGHHSFTYSLYPHQGGWFEAETTKEAYELNYPLSAFRVTGKGGELPLNLSFINIDSKSTILETIKKAEDDDKLILRFYEYGNQRDNVRVKLPTNIKNLTECNLMEKEISKIIFEDNYFSFEIKPYEIKTFKVDVCKI